MKSNVKANQNIVDREFVRKTNFKMKVFSNKEIITKTDSKLTKAEKDNKVKTEQKHKVKTTQKLNKK